MGKASNSTGGKHRADALHQLIRSLTKGEKRFFKLSASIYGGDKSYLKLFDVMDSQPEFDEDAIRQKLSGERFLKNNYFKVKKRLYELILKSLNEHRSNLVDHRIKDLMKSVGVLREKNLYSQAAALLREARTLAEDYEMIWHMAEVLIWEHRIDIDKYDVEDRKKHLEKVQRESAHVAQSFRDLFDSIVALDLITLYSLRTQYVRTKEQDKGLSEAFAALQELDRRGIGFGRALRTIYHGYASYYKMMGDLESSYAYSVKMVAHLEEHTKRIHAYPEAYVAAHTNMMNTLLSLGRYDECDRVLQKVRKLTKRNLAAVRTRLT